MRIETLSYSMTRAEYVEHATKIAIAEFGSKRLYWGIGSAVLAVVGIILFVGMRESIVGFVAGASYTFAVINLAYSHTVKKLHTKMANDPRNARMFQSYVIAVADEAVEVIGESGSRQTFPWSSFCNVVDLEGGVLLMGSSLSFFHVPERAFGSSQEFADFRRMCIEKTSTRS
ncbi:MAG: YcxB family protein [Fimbriimonadales bacterium]